MTESLPKHIAIIMDGNGRWAQQHQLPRSEGHKAGYKAAQSVVRHAGKIGIKVLTLFAFSSENWRRPQDEVGHIMDLFYLALTEEIGELHKNNVQLRIIGDITSFSAKIHKNIERGCQLTANNSGLILVIAANYGGKWDILQAARSLAKSVQRGELEAETINEDLFNQRLATAGLPEPDLFIRPGAEYRLSNYLIWQLAYSELYFPNMLWPDFDEKALDAAIQYFQSKERRFGFTSKQIQDSKG